MILFEAVAATLKTIAADARYLGGELGFIAILHTWGQTLTHHPPIHCLVPGGALVDGQRWRACRSRFFLPTHCNASEAEATEVRQTCYMIVGRFHVMSRGSGCPALPFKWQRTTRFLSAATV